MGHIARVWSGNFLLPMSPQQYPSGLCDKISQTSISCGPALVWLKTGGT